MTEIEQAEAANELTSHLDRIAILFPYAIQNAQALAFHRAEALTILDSLKGALLNA